MSRFCRCCFGALLDKKDHRMSPFLYNLDFQALLVLFDCMYVIIRRFGLSSLVVLEPRENHESDKRDKGYNIC